MGNSCGLMLGKNYKVCFNIQGRAKGRFTVVCMENNTVINNIRINHVFCVLTAVNLCLPHLALKSPS